MAGFRTNPALEPLDNGRRWKLADVLVYDSDLLNDTVVVPAGFECDLNSLPRIAWIVSPKTDYPRCGALHDWGYAGNFKRDVADKLYREALQSEGQGGFRSGFRYYALRLFGRFAYRALPL